MVLMVGGAVGDSEFEGTVVGPEEGTEAGTAVGGSE
jgi:hypothetical protein